MHQNEMCMTMFVDPQTCKIMLALFPKKSVQLTMHSRLSFSINHAFKDEWLGIQVHSQNKFKEKLGRNMVSEKNIPTNTSQGSEIVGQT